MEDGKQRRQELPSLEIPYEKLKLGERKSKKTVLDQNSPDYQTQIDGVGPWEGEFPDDPRLDLQLLREEIIAMWLTNTATGQLKQSGKILQKHVPNCRLQSRIWNMI
ncbi:hypothetical protein RQN30_05595 [Arcanobacterium hippocoleae]